MRTRFRPLLVLIMLIAAMGWGLRLAPGRTNTPPDSLPPYPDSTHTTAPPSEAPALYASAEQVAASPSGQPPVQMPFFGFCPEDAPASGPLRRPSLGAHLTVGQQEMIDRARAMRRDRATSEELREGLNAFFADDERTALAALAQAPDRLHGGFDFAATAAHIFGARRLHDNDPKAALRLAEYALSVAPDQAAGHVLGSLAKQRLGDRGGHREALLRAHELEPDDAAIALSTGRALAHTPQLGDAVRALDVYLRDNPQDVPIAQLRARLMTQRDIQHGLTESRRDGVRLLWPQEALDDSIAATTLEAIVSALKDAARLTGMARTDELLAVVYREHSELLAVTCVPTWTQGVFDGTLRLHVASLTRPAERNRVVRHEVLHAQVRSGRFAAPQWFHEGLAQYFAGEQGEGHRRTFRLMIENRSYVPFPSLEGSFLVISQGRDARFAYHQSLAMIDLLVDRRGEQAIRTGIDFLSGGGDAKLLWDHMAQPGNLEGDDLLAFLERRLAAR